MLRGCVGRSGRRPLSQSFPSGLPAQSNNWVAGRLLRASGALILGGDGSETGTVRGGGMCVCVFVCVCVCTAGGSQADLFTGN